MKTFKNKNDLKTKDNPLNKNWNARYAMAIKELSSLLSFLEESYGFPVSSGTPIYPTHFDGHNAVIGNAVSVLSKITSDDDEFFTSEHNGSSLEILRRALFRANENIYLTSLGYDTQKNLLLDNEDTNPTLNYKEAYLEILEVVISMTRSAMDHTSYEE